MPSAELPFEYLLNALRLNEGFEQSEFELRTGLPFEMVGERLAQARQRGLMDTSGTRWRPSTRGLNFLNDLLAEFVPSGRCRA